MTPADSTSPNAAARRPSHRVRVERIVDRAADTRSLFLRMDGSPMPAFVPGMFISVSIPLANETRVRPYTIASSPEDGEPFEICFNRVAGGVGVGWLFERHVGDVLEFTGPFGTFILDRIPDANLVFIAEGTAIAPIRPMIRRVSAAKSDRTIDLLYAASDREHILYRSELERIAAGNPKFRFETLIAESGSDPYERLTAEIERRWVNADSDRNRHFYLCGVGNPVLKIRDLLRNSGYERRSVHYEKW